MLIRDPSKRFSAEQALDHEWFSEVKKQSPKRAVGKALAQLRNSGTSNKFQQVVESYVTSQLLPDNDLNRLSRIFNDLDIKQDGKLDIDELRTGFSSFPELNVTENELGQIMERADMNQNGVIDFSEFINAAYPRTSQLSENNLKFAF